MHTHVLLLFVQWTEQQMCCIAPTGCLCPSVHLPTARIEGGNWKVWKLKYRLGSVQWTGSSWKLKWELDARRPPWKLKAPKSVKATPGGFQGHLTYGHFPHLLMSCTLWKLELSKSNKLLQLNGSLGITLKMPVDSIEAGARNYKKPWQFEIAVWGSGDNFYW